MSWLSRALAALTGSGYSRSSRNTRAAESGQEATRRDGRSGMPRRIEHLGVAAVLSVPPTHRRLCGRDCFRMIGVAWSNTHRVPPLDELRERARPYARSSSKAGAWSARPRTLGSGVRRHGCELTPALEAESSGQTEAVIVKAEPSLPRRHFEQEAIFALIVQCEHDVLGRESPRVLTEIGGQVAIDQRDNRL
jgi:hypothetical protein